MRKDMDKENWMIAIPSYGRSEHLLTRINTLDHMEPWELDHTWLFVREEEIDAYLPVAEKYGCGLTGIMLPSEAGVVETRDEIFWEAKRENIKYLFMIDDDIDFAYKPDARKYITMTEGNQIYFRPMISMMMEYCEPHCPVVGITSRQFSQEKIAKVAYNTRIIQVYCWYMPTIFAEGLAWSDPGMPYMTDYWIILELLSRGYENACLNRWCRDDTAQMAGGCEIQRTPVLQSKSAVMLARLFPEVVHPYYKTSGTWKEKRINVRVQWKKAYDIGVAKHGKQTGHR